MSEPLHPLAVDLESLPRDRQLVDGGGESLRPEDGGLVQLRRDNTIAAVALGLMAGDLAIRDVLSGGALGILGPKR